MRRLNEVTKRCTISDNGIWAYPLNINWDEIPDIGFKIHISAIISNAVAIYDNIVDILNENNSAYKFAASAEMLKKINSGELGYSQIGKFLTVYPRNNSEFSFLLEKLHRATLGFQSVSIPSDYRYKNSCVVFYRYGALTARGSAVNADNRIKHIPNDVYVPVSDYYLKRFDSFPDRYIPIKCLRARGKSRIFSCIDTLTKNKVILKQGIKLGEIDGNGQEGSNNIIHEADILEKLSGVEAFPKLIECFYVEQSFCIVEEYKEGKTLKELLQGNDCHAIVGLKKIILLQVLETIEILNQKEIFIGDLSPDNIIISGDYKLSFIDFEYYYFKDKMDYYNTWMPWTPGFCCKEYRGQKAVVYALLSLWYYIENPHEYQNNSFNEECWEYKCELQKYEKVIPNARKLIEISDWNALLNILKHNLINIED